MNELRKVAEEEFGKFNIGPSYKVYPTVLHPDYFHAESHNSLMRQNPEFGNIEDLRKTIIGQMNEDFGHDVHILTLTDKYIRTQCIYQGCPYQNWYHFKEPKPG